LEEKQRIVSESYGGPRLVSVTARRNGLRTWRRLAREGKLALAVLVNQFKELDR